MNNLIAFPLPAALAVLSYSASAGVAPAAPNSALAQSGAKIAPPASQSTDGKEDNNKRAHQENTQKDLVK